MEDSSVDMASFLGQALGTRLARITNNHFTVGTGSSQPKGITVAAADSGVTTAATAAVTRDELVSTMMSVDPAYRANAKWMFSDTVLQYILKLTDDTNQPLWLPGNNGPVGDTILGMPYVVNQDMPTGAGAKAIAFGDLSKYLVREVTDIQFLQLNERYADYHQVGFLAFLRADGDLLDAGTNPVKYATLKS
jgi:HK97 family phage major capsid protein